MPATNGCPCRTVECAEHARQAINGKTAKVGVADPRIIGRGEACRFASLPDAEAAIVQCRDSVGSQDRLGVFEVRIRISEIPEDVSCPFDEFEFRSHRPARSHSCLHLSSAELTSWRAFREADLRAHRAWRNRLIRWHIPNWTTTHSELDGHELRIGRS